MMQQDAGFTCSCLISVLVKALSHLPFQGRPPALAAVLLPASAAAELCPSSRVAAVATKTEAGVSTGCDSPLNREDASHTSYSVINLFPSLSLRLSSFCKDINQQCETRAA